MMVESIVKDVVPHAGTWIEILLKDGTKPEDAVVPHAGTWIEIGT